MLTEFCALCDTKLTLHNMSKEHIIPNAIGGRKVIKNFICNPCNNQTGESWDAALSKQLHDMSLFLSINRQRKPVPHKDFKTVKGDDIRIKPNGQMGLIKPTCEIEETTKGLEINLQVRDEKELKIKLKEIQKKYSGFHIDQNKLLNQAEKKSFYISDMIKFSAAIGGREEGKSIVKTAWAFAVSNGLQAKICEHAKAYLIEDKKACFGYYYEKDLIKNRPIGVPIHCLSIKGNPTNKQLIAYVEYFGVYRMIIGLSNNYRGSAFSSTYAINPVIGKEIEIDVELDLSPDDVEATYRYEKYMEEEIREAFNVVLSARQDKSYENELSKVVAQSYEQACARLGLSEGDVLSPKQAREFSKLISANMEQFLLHILH